MAALALLWSLAAGPALAQTAADDSRAELQALLPQAQLVGKGRLTFWGFQVYDARLWANPGFKAQGFASDALALELSYLRGFDSQAVAERSITEMRRSAAISDEQAGKWMAAMARVLPDVQKGDRVMGVHRPGVGAAFWMNGKPTGEIRDAEFARLFFGIWLAPTTSEPGLRTALLAGAAP
ncbi:MAG: hypothetical protein EOO54_09155 [Haliea sp.]|nr:MAG: hypothetical protein EOO54_09155 [Haliea sp.]